MTAVPTLSDHRANLATWLVPTRLLPALTAVLSRLLPAEEYDPTLAGQRLETTYFDTQSLDLRRARLKKDRYLTLRIRCYQGEGPEAYALSAKTEESKWTRPLPSEDAEAILAGDVGNWWESLLTPDLLERLAGLTDEPLVRSARLVCRRYAVEDDVYRYTLDVEIRSAAALRPPLNVLEYKTADEDAPPHDEVMALGLQPIRLSKFLWASGMGGM